MREVEKLIALVQQRSILQKAVRLTWRNFEKDWPSDSWMSDIAHFKLLLITINVNLPNIKIIESKFQNYLFKWSNFKLMLVFFSQH
jgi:hypothetical protein